ncbi:GNAT family N-acetyltransferase [Ornithinibacillus halotolerans]|uniref:N-acetyltransferase n=1 Tax=Ornithinibacillus halotolerans TaxID=1274357 RepID=A0A916RZS4_9BACI|nr:GNAT family N-acetyltransferase [Ornithinibacillus halotolerans]GGA74354.1 N-acetyltransferase [Ornithinibacillus halotolerans]
MEIREYKSKDEQGWLRCRVLSFLDTAYYDNVLREKEVYENPAIELVAVEDGNVVGLIDIEYEVEERTVCSRGSGLGGMIWHIAVHPDYRRKGIGTLLLDKAEQLAREKNLNRFEAWTRDDEWVNIWYEKSGFRKVDSYLHVFMEGDEELKGHLKSEVPHLYPILAFAHYVGEDTETINSKFSRVHECRCYEKKLR